MADTFCLTVITPTKIFYEGEVSMVEYTTSVGDIGVYAGHIPMINVIAPGILKIHEDGEIKRAALLSGFSQILQDHVVIMAEVCEWPDEIDTNRAKEAEERARRRLTEHSPELDIARAELALKRALVRQDMIGK